MRLAHKFTNLSVCYLNELGSKLFDASDIGFSFTIYSKLAIAFITNPNQAPKKRFY